LTHRDSKIAVGPSDVGFGIGQLLPILVQAAISRIDSTHLRPRVICVEQPEIHLHPRLQAKVADIFLETVNQPNRRYTSRGVRGLQWVVETHSEMIIRRIQRRIREGHADPANISVLYVQPKGQHGSEVINLPLDAHGDFTEEWPGGFFDEGFEEMFGTTDAG